MLNELKISIKKPCLNCRGTGKIPCFNFNPHRKTKGKIQVDKMDCYECKGVGFVTEDIEFDKFAELIVDAVLFRLNKKER